MSTQLVRPVTPRGPSGPRCKFGDRLVAYILDRLILAVPSTVIFVFTTNFEAFYGLDTVLSLVYFTGFFGSARGQTLGMRANGIRVYDFSGRGPIGYRRGALRYLGLILSEFTLGLGFLWMLWDREKQTWADKIADTVVAPAWANPVG